MHLRRAPSTPRDEEIAPTMVSFRMTPQARTLRTRAAAISLLAFAAVAFLVCFSGTARALDAGDRAPDFAAPNLSGAGTVELSQYRGKVVYLDFWASWCGPCLKAVPAIEEMRSEFPADRFQILAVNLDQKKKKALRFLEKNPVGYPSASDPKGRLPTQFGLETMPTSYLIDGDGVIRYVHRGFKTGDDQKLREEIRALLGGR
jgi:peroxiredoxin